MKQEFLGLLYLPAYGIVTYEGELLVDVGTGEDERGICTGENQRTEVLRALKLVVRDGLYQRDAGEPV